MRLVVLTQCATLLYGQINKAINERDLSNDTCAWLCSDPMVDFDRF